jgi:hypothetical protein
MGKDLSKITTTIIKRHKREHDVALESKIKELLPQVLALPKNIYSLEQLELRADHFEHLSAFSTKDEIKVFYDAMSYMFRYLHERDSKQYGDGK